MKGGIIYNNALVAAIATLFVVSSINVRPVRGQTEETSGGVMDIVGNSGNVEPIIGFIGNNGDVGVIGFESPVPTPAQMSVLPIPESPAPTPADPGGILPPDQTPAPVSVVVTPNTPVPVPVFTSSPTPVPVPQTPLPTALPITASPTANPTPVPVPQTLAPTALPITPSPTDNPTPAPVLPQTPAPTNVPTVTIVAPTSPAPEPVPTSSMIVGANYCTFSPDPTCYSTGWPECCSKAALVCPLEQPPCDVEPPVAAPVAPPTTAAPVSVLPKTPVPTATQTAAPTTASAPTSTQTMAPTTASPTVTATVLTTQTPSASPSVAATTATPTTPPTYPFVNQNVTGLNMLLEGVTVPLSESAQTAFETTYAEHCTLFWDADIEQISKDMLYYQTTVTFLNEEEYTPVPAEGGRRILLRSSSRFQIRSVQETTEGSAIVYYDQDITYQTSTPETIDINKAVLAPFNSGERRNVFADLLRESDAAYTNLQTVGKPRGLTDEGDPQPKTGMDTTTIIIIAVCSGVGGLLVLCIGILLCRRSRRRSKGSPLDDEEKPPSKLELSTAGGDDGVSTLAEPVGRPAGVQSGEELAGYGDQSVATVDYDYSKAYGGGGEASVVSSAGGTLGQQTSGGGTLGSGGAAAAGLAAGAAGASIFSDDASFEQSYGANVSVKEEMIEIYAPPGKLGVVIDTPDEGAPVVHAIKDSSCIADQLKVGDKLIAVDDEDVRAMTAIKVSKMISRKSANAQRKLTIVRTTVSE